MKHLAAAIFTLGVLVDLRVIYQEPTEGFGVAIREPGLSRPQFARGCFEPGPCYIELTPKKGYILYRDGRTDSKTIFIP